MTLPQMFMSAAVYCAGHNSIFLSSFGPSKTCHFLFSWDTFTYLIVLL